MSLALFDLEAPEWAPVYEPRGGWEARGVSATESTPEEWVAFQRSLRCRDCGGLMRRLRHTRSCGGVRDGGSFELCDDCAALDGCRLRCCEPIAKRGSGSLTGIEHSAVCGCGWWLAYEHRDDDGDWLPYTVEEVADAVAEHMIPRHVSHWGMTHFLAEHDALTVGQAKRRAEFLAGAA